MADWLDVDAPPLSEAEIRERFRQEGWQKVDVDDRQRSSWHQVTVEPDVTHTAVSIAQVAFHFEHGRSLTHVGLAVR